MANLRRKHLALYQFTIFTGLNYTTIQEAIDANETLDGHTILVDEGTYYENVLVNKTLSLIGANSESTIIDGNGTGNVVEISNNVTLSGFTVRNSGGDFNSGIRLDGGENCCISENRVINNDVGISIWSSVATPTLSVVTENDIANSSVGMYLDEAYNTTITANTITGSSDKGIQMFASQYNTFFYNNLVRNNIQVTNWGESGEWPNVWDNGNSSGGNFWSDYNGTDTGNIGFGETPYNVGPYLVGNIDHYPLMGMFNSFNATPQYSVHTVCNSTISDFQFNGTAISFNAAGQNGTTGFCRISIPTALINGGLTILVNGTEVPYTLLPESNNTQSYLYFTYSHSTEQIIIAPEFPSFLILPLFMIATPLAVMVYKKKGVKTSQSQTEPRERKRNNQPSLEARAKLRGRLEEAEFNRQLCIVEDFYSARAVTHASYFVATIFGLFAVIPSVEAYPQESRGYWHVIKVLLAIAFLFVFLLGCYCFMNFNYYSSLAQRAESITAKDAEDALFGGEEVEISYSYQTDKKTLNPP